MLVDENPDNPAKNKSPNTNENNNFFFLAFNRF